MAVLTPQGFAKLLPFWFQIISSRPVLSRLAKHLFHALGGCYRARWGASPGSSSWRTMRKGLKSVRVS